MKIHLPTKKIQLSEGCYTYHSDIFDVKPIKYLRESCGPNRYYYFVFFKVPSGVRTEPGAVNLLENNITKKHIGVEWINID